MTWNYRIVERTDKTTGETTQGIYEVYYDDKMLPSMVTENPVRMEWELGSSTHLILGELKDAFRKPVLLYEDFLHKEVF